MKYLFVEELINNAFKKANNSTKNIYDIKEKNLTKIQIVYQYIDSRLEKIYKEIEIPEDKFYLELYKLIFPKTDFKKVKERIKYIRKLLKDLYIK
jgi:GTP1/Obg family GTP-binding protein